MFLTQEFSDIDGVFVQIFDSSQAQATSFITPDSSNFQIGIAVNNDAKTYVPHVHTSIERTITGTAEFIFILQGRMDVVFLDGAGKPVGKTSITSQMGFVQTRGGHAISTEPNTRFIEVKQGPYMGHDADKYAVQVPAEYM